MKILWERIRVTCKRSVAQLKFRLTSSKIWLNYSKLRLLDQSFDMGQLSSVNYTSSYLAPWCDALYMMYRALVIYSFLEDGDGAIHTQVTRRYFLLLSLLAYQERENKTVMIANWKNRMLRFLLAFSKQQKSRQTNKQQTNKRRYTQQMLHIPRFFTQFNECKPGKTGHTFYVLVCKLKKYEMKIWLHFL